MFKVLFATFCLAIALQECASQAPAKGGLKCFVCNSAKDGSCSDNFEEDSPALRNHFLTDCDDLVDEKGVTHKAYCKKVTMWLESETRVDRSCANHRRDTGEKACYQSRADDHVVQTCACDKDACNSAALPLPSLLALPALAAALLRA